MENRQDSTYRYERKFVAQGLDRQSVERIILDHPAFFSEIYQSRYVNNIYFDSIHFDNLIDNIEGNKHRQKYRIRWYGESMGRIELPILENKIKTGLTGTKRLQSLSSFKLERNINASDLKNVIYESDVNDTVKFSLSNQIPVLINRYNRTYFESNDRRFRITIDDDQSFTKINTFNNTFLQLQRDLERIIIELKYDIQHDEDAAFITNQLPFRISKNSKYAHGMNTLYHT